MILVSACLVGQKCRHDGRSASLKSVMDLVPRESLLPLCPEQLGGLPTPRPPAEISSGSGEDILSGQAQIFNQAGENVTENFIKGARETLRLAKQMKVRKAILKTNSPSCGVGRIKRRDHSARGNGVTTALLLKNNIKVFSCSDV